MFRAGGVMAKPHILPKMIRKDLVAPVPAASARVRAVTLLADLFNTPAGGKANDAGHINDCPEETIFKHLTISFDWKVTGHLKYMV